MLTITFFDTQWCLSQRFSSFFLDSIYYFYKVRIGHAKQQQNLTYEDTKIFSLKQIYITHIQMKTLNTLHSTILQVAHHTCFQKDKSKLLVSPFTLPR